MSTGDRRFYTAGPECQQRCFTCAKFLYSSGGFSREPHEVRHNFRPVLRRRQCGSSIIYAPADVALGKIACVDGTLVIAAGCSRARQIIVNAKVLATMVFDGPVPLSQCIFRVVRSKPDTNDQKLRQPTLSKACFLGFVHISAGISSLRQ